ncbi:MAG: glycosyltransferase, partial [Campylobacter sp.]|nr:glycosyltransferase [Campylobacter sp.]
RELLGDDEWGILVGVNDEEGTIKAMQKAIDEPEFAKIYEKKAKIRAEFFNKNKIAKDLIKDLKEIYAKG